MISPLPRHRSAGKGLRVSYTTSIQIVIQIAEVYDCLIWINSCVIGAWMMLASVFKLYFLHTFLGKVPELGELDFDLPQEKKKSRPLAFVHEPFLSYFKECWKWSLAPEAGSFALNAVFRLVGGCFSSSACLSSPAASMIQSHQRCLWAPAHQPLHSLVLCVLTVRRGPPDWPAWAVQVTSSCTSLQSALCSGYKVARVPCDLPQHYLSHKPCRFWCVVFQNGDFPGIIYCVLVETSVFSLGFAIYVPHLKILNFHLIFCSVLKKENMLTFF